VLIAGIGMMLLIATARQKYGRQVIKRETPA
jgi:hypothetical protein